MRDNENKKREEKEKNRTKSFACFMYNDFYCFNKKLEQESPDFSQERNALFLFLYQLLSVLVPDVLFYNLFAHIPQSTHVVTVAP